MRAILVLACLPLVAPAAPPAQGAPAPAVIGPAGVSGIDDAWRAEMKAALVAAFREPVVTKAPAAPAWAGATCQVMRPTGPGRADAGSGTCIACDGTRSLILSNNHIFSDQALDGTFPPARCPVVAKVAPRGQHQRYPAVCVAADATADLSLVVADVVMPVAELAEADAPAGASVAHLGVGSGGGEGRVIRPPYPGDAASAFASTAPSIDGDSGAGLFDEANRLVAVNCGRFGGRNEMGPQRGTPVSAVRVLIVSRAERSGPIARLRDKLTGRTVTVDAPPAVSIDARLSAIEARLSALESRKPEASPAAGTMVVPSSPCPGGVCPTRPEAVYAPQYAPAYGPQPRRCRLFGGCR